MKKEFYVLIRGCQVLSVNWAGHGKDGVYIDYSKGPYDKIIKVREVKRDKTHAKSKIPPRKK